MYKRNGTRNLFVFCEPKGGWRHIEVTERRTALLRSPDEVAGRPYPDATIRSDNLNTHKLSGCFERGSPSAWNSTTLQYTAVG